MLVIAVFLFVSGNSRAWGQIAERGFRHCVQNQSAEPAGPDTIPVLELGTGVGTGRRAKLGEIGDLYVRFQ